MFHHTKWENRQLGFTLAELLVVIAIIGLLSTMAVVSVSSARAKARDARRVSDIKQIQTSLELYFSDMGTYPITTGEVPIGVTDETDTLTDAGFESASSPSGTVVYMGEVPGNFENPANIMDYMYESLDGGAYTIRFEVESIIAGYSGTLIAHPSGISEYNGT